MFTVSPVGVEQFHAFISKLGLVTCGGWSLPFARSFELEEARAI